MRVSSDNTAIRQPDLFMCNYEGCNVAFGRKKTLFRHLRAHLKTDEKQCPHCELRFPQAANLKAHVNRKHLGLRPACPDCHEDFADKSALVRHRKRKHGYEAKKYRTTKVIIKEVQETRPGQLLIERVSTLPATRSAAAATALALSPSPSPVTPPPYNDANDFWNLYGNMGMPVLPQAAEVYPAHNAGFPLEGLFPATTMATSSFFPLPDSFQSPMSMTVASGVFNDQNSANTFANYSAVADPDLIDIYADLFGCPQF